MPKEEPFPKKEQRPLKDRVLPAPIAVAPPKPPKTLPELLKKCQRVLGLLGKHKMSEPFRVPVDPEALGIPDYFHIIKEPMDLSTVEKRLNSGAYATVQQFALDVRKIWANAIRYNPPVSPVFQATVVMRDYFEKVFKEIDDTVPQEETVAEQLQRKAVKTEKKIEEVRDKGLAINADLASRPPSKTEMRQLTHMIKGPLRSHRPRRVLPQRRARHHDRRVPAAG